MVQAYKANLGLLVLSGAGFGHHLLFFRGIDPKIVYSTCGSSAEDYIRTRYVLQGSSTNVISNNMVSTNPIFQLYFNEVA